MKYGKILVRLTLAAAAANSLTRIEEPKWGTFSPDGSKIVYVSKELKGVQAGYDIFVVNADGSGKVRLDLQGDDPHTLYFSPDGSKIAFITGHYPSPGNLFLVNVNGTNLKRLAAYGDGNSANWMEMPPGVSGRLAFSPYRGRVFYSASTSGNADIFAVNFDGSAKKRLTDSSRYDEIRPIFLPGSDKILFTKRRTRDPDRMQGGEIWIMNADGSAKKKLLGSFYNCLEAVSPDGRRLAYAKKRWWFYPFGFSRRLYVADLDGSNRFGIAVQNRWPRSVSFSPDGKRILYHLDDGLYIINADGTGEKNLTPWWYHVSQPTFFAGGSKITFLGRRRYGGILPDCIPPKIYTMDADGSNQQFLKATKDMYISELIATPKGERFLFRRDYEGLGETAPSDYFVINADGSGLKRITDYYSYDTKGGTFSPRGTKFAYIFNDASDTGEGCAIHTVNADGSGKTRFDLKGGTWGVPYFSPDGSKIAFISDGYSFRNGNLFLIDVDGTNLKRLTAYGDDPFETKLRLYPTSLGALDEGLTFSPDGRRILYCSKEYGSRDIFAVNVDGTGKTRLTAFANCDESAPIFVRGGAQILFTAKSRGEKSGTWIMNADGSAKKKLLSPPWTVLALSRDGETAAWTNNDAHPDYGKYILCVGDPTRRIKIAEGEGAFEDVSFSPNGKKILFRQGSTVFVVSADGSDAKILLGAWDSVYSPVFFAGSAKIAFVGGRKSGDAPNIYTMDAGGSNLRLLKAAEGIHIKALTVLPTRNKFLFTGYEGSAPVDYFVVNADGTGLKRLSGK